MNCGPFSQEQLETLRAASSQISNAWDKLVEPVKRFGEKYGSAQISECGGFMDRTPEAEAKFRKALVKARLLQDNSNIQPPMIRQFFIYPYDTLFPPKETTNGKTEDNNRSQIDSTESHGQIRDSASLDRNPARNQSNHRDSAQNQRQPQETQSELRTGDLRRNPESDRGSSMSKEDKIRGLLGSRNVQKAREHLSRNQQRPDALKAGNCSIPLEAPSGAQRAGNSKTREVMEQLCMTIHLNVWSTKSAL